MSISRVRLFFVKTTFKTLQFLSRSRHLTNRSFMPNIAHFRIFCYKFYDILKQSRTYFHNVVNKCAIIAFVLRALSLTCGKNLSLFTKVVLKLA